MRIGTPILTWDDCDRCAYFDEEHGCRRLGELEIMTDEENGAIVCLTGSTSEPDDEDIDFTEPWE